MRSTRGVTPSPASDGPPNTSFDLAPDGVYQAGRVTPTAGALLPHRFTLTGPGTGGLFSVALSCGSPRLAASQHPVLRSPDLPQPMIETTGRGHPMGSPDHLNGTAKRHRDGRILDVDHTRVVGEMTRVSPLVDGEEGERGGSGLTTQSAFEEVGGWPAILRQITAGSDLDRDQAKAVMSEILNGQASPAQIGGLLIGLAVKGESTDEMAGFVESMLATSEPLTIPDGAIDIVGTGGSGHRQAHAVNASTMACIVAAAAGATVCKHGNRKASSTSGSFDFLEALGVDISMSIADVERCVAEIGVGFAFARSFHPAMRFAGPVRAELGIPTVFNALGPLAHPGRIRRQLVGVATEQKAEALADVLAELGSHRAWVVAGADGLDEVATSGPSVIFDVTPAGISRHTVELAAVGVDRVELAQVAGGSPQDNVAIFERIVDGQTGPHRDLVVINAGAGLVVAGLAEDLNAGVIMAREALDSGAAKDKLDQLRAFSESTTAG